MTIKWNLRIELKIVMALIVLSLLISFVERKQNKNVCRLIDIKLNNAHDNYFLDKADIMKILERDDQSIKKQKFDDLNFMHLENQLQNNPYISEAQLYNNLKGTLIVKVSLRRPVARLITPSGKDMYIAEDGLIIPSSPKFVPRTLLVSGSVVQKLISLGDAYLYENGNLMQTILFIDRYPFWKKQIAQLHVGMSGRIVIYPQITRQLIEFGYPIDIDRKFQKINIFYKKILPQMGWGKYKRVNVEYQNQIIAEIK